MRNISPKKGFINKRKGNWALLVADIIIVPFMIWGLILLIDFGNLVSLWYYLIFTGLCVIGSGIVLYATRHLSVISIKVSILQSIGISPLAYPFALFFRWIAFNWGYWILPESLHLLSFISFLTAFPIIYFIVYLLCKVPILSAAVGTFVLCSTIALISLLYGYPVWNLSSIHPRPMFVNYFVEHSERGPCWSYADSKMDSYGQELYADYEYNTLLLIAHGMPVNVKYVGTGIIKSSFSVGHVDNGLSVETGYNENALIVILPNGKKERFKLGSGLAEEFYTAIDYPHKRPYDNLLNETRELLSSDQKAKFDLFINSNKYSPQSEGGEAGGC